MAKKHIEIGPTTVRKQGSVDSIRIELEKMRAASILGQKSGLYRVPRILEHHESRSIFTMERLAPAQPVREIRGNSADEIAVFGRAGCALAEIHRSLSLPEALRVQLPEALPQDGPQSFIHGDFSKENVLFIAGPGSGELGVIDWQTTPIYGGLATYGPSLFDVAWFVSGLFLEHPGRQGGSWHISEKAGAFIAAYLDEADAGIKYADVARYSAKLYQVRCHEALMRWHAGRRWLLSYGMRRWRQFFERY